MSCASDFTVELAEIDVSMPLHTFLIIGAPKCGTTSLHYYMSVHPNIYMSRNKEPHFFDYNYEKGLEHYSRTHFGGWQGQMAIGEATPSYLSLPFAAQRIKTHLPSIKLIVILRNPVDRAYSAWWMNRSRGREKLSFEAAIRDNLANIRGGISFEGAAGARLWGQHYASVCGGKVRTRFYLNDGYYAKHLTTYLNVFGRSQLKIVLTEELRTNPQKTIEALWSFVGTCQPYRLKNVTPQNFSLGRLAPPVWGFLKRAALEQTVARLPYSLRRTFKLVLTSITGRPRMRQSTRDMLLKHYAPHNEVLSVLIDRDLNSWSS